jgi:hypothetical protein
MAKPQAGNRDTAASAKVAVMGAFKRIMISEGAERQSTFYTIDSLSIV